MSNIFNIDLNNIPTFHDADNDISALINRCNIFEAAYDKADSMWMQASHHDVGCECEKCILEYARSVFNHLQNRKSWNGKVGGKWGVGEDTATLLCHDIMDDYAAKNFQPIGDFHSISVHASTVDPEIAVATAFHDIEKCFRALHPAHILPSGSISPRMCFMLKAEYHWNRNPFKHSWHDMNESVYVALILLMVSWARGLAGEGMTYAALSALAKKHNYNIRWASNNDEHDDVDIIITTPSGIDRFISVKTGRSLGKKTIKYYRNILHKTKPNFYAGGTGIITTKNLIILSAKDFN